MLLLVLVLVLVLVLLLVAVLYTLQEQVFLTKALRFLQLSPCLSENLVTGNELVYYEVISG